MKRKIIDYASIILGCFIVSIGFVFFINPYKFVPGGVFGTSIVLHHIFPEWQVGTFGYLIGIPLLALAYFLLGKGIGLKTCLATIASPLFMNIVSVWAYPSQEALQSLSPQLLWGGTMDLSNNLILAAIIGPVLVGIGEGFIIKAHATSGGTDIVAMIIHKYLRTKFSNTLICVDAIVVLLGFFVIGGGFTLTGYSLICIFLMSRTLAYVVSGSKNKKLMFIVTHKDNKELRDFVINRLDRTGTVLDGSGLYSQEDKMTLMMVVRMREVEAVTSAIKTIDPDVFVIVTDAYDAYGYRWKAFPDKNTIELS